MYNIPQDLKAKSQVFHGVDASTFFVVLAGGLIGYFLSSTLGLVSDKFTIIFNIFNIVVFLWLMMPSMWNRGKQNYQSILYAFVNDKYTYHQISYPITSAESCLKTPLLDEEIRYAAKKSGVDLDAIRKQEDEERWKGLRKDDSQ